MNKIFYEQGNPLHIRAALGSPGNFNIGGATEGPDFLGKKLTMRMLGFEQFSGVMFPTFNEGETPESKQREKFEVYFINDQGLVCCLLIGGSYSPANFRQNVLRPRLNMKTGQLCQIHELTVTASIVPKEKPGQKFSVINFEVAIADEQDSQERSDFLQSNKLFSYEIMSEKLRWSQFYNFSRSVNVFDVYNNPLTISATDQTLQIGNE